MNILKTHEQRLAAFNSDRASDLGTDDARYVYVEDHIYFDRVEREFVAYDETGDEHIRGDFWKVKYELERYCREDLG